MIDTRQTVPTHIGSHYIHQSAWTHNTQCHTNEGWMYKPLAANVDRQPEMSHRNVAKL